MFQAGKRRKKGSPLTKFAMLMAALMCMLQAGCSTSDNVAEIATEAQVQEVIEQETETQEIAAEETESEAAGDTESSTEEKKKITASYAAIQQAELSTEVAISPDEVPAYSGDPYVEVNGNIPQFEEEELSTSSYEYYSDLNSLGGCGVVYACIGTDIMPTEERGEIGQVKPTGWHTVKYDVVDGKYLYNRCHLIGYQLTGENANTKNLITGTRYLNVKGMLPFENMVADYVKETGNHVMYRVTPVFEGDNLLASGVQIEAESVEDKGDGILFNVYCYNVQPEVTIDYATGESSCESADTTTDNANNAESVSDTTGSTSDAESAQTVETPADTGSTTMVWKSATGSKYHSRNDCGNMNPANATQITEQQAINEGLEKCKKCW